MTSDTHLPITVAAMYKFVGLPDFEDLRAPLQQLCKENDIMGTLLLAHEGINGTVAGPQKGIEALLIFLRNDSRLADIAPKYAYAQTNPFLRMKVRLKKEIVSLGMPSVDPNNTVGTYIEPKDWNDFISRDDVIVVDTRNDYEVKIGTFKGALNPTTATFREFPAWVEKATALQNKPKVAMFCTGGIRCEKSTSYLKELGYDDVYHLKGGILQYLEDVPESESLWEGECFVFDNRVSVDHSLNKGSYEMCHACRSPLTPEEVASLDYEKGVQCPHCVDVIDAKHRERFIERQRQVMLAAQRGEKHIGQASV